MLFSINFRIYTIRGHENNPPNDTENDGTKSNTTKKIKEKNFLPDNVVQVWIIPGFIT